MLMLMLDRAECDGPDARILRYCGRNRDAMQINAVRCQQVVYTVQQRGEASVQWSASWRKAQVEMTETGTGAGSTHEL